MKLIPITRVIGQKIALNLHDLGQLLIYCKLCNPEEAYLLSSSGLGSLNKILNNLNREDLLDYGSVRIIKKLKLQGGALLKMV